MGKRLSKEMGQVVSGDDRMERKEEEKKGKAAVVKITQGTGNYFYLIAASLL